MPKFTRLGTGERSPVEQETTIICRLCLTWLSIIHKFCHPRECFWFHLIYIVYKQFTRRYIWLYQFTMHDPRIHNPVMHDSCINYALCKHALHYIEINHDSKNLSVICKDLVSWMRKISLTKEVAVFKKLLFSLLKFSDENNIAKLVIDMWWNCSNRLFQLTFPGFIIFQNFLFCWYFRKFVNSFLNYPQNKLVKLWAISCRNFTNFWPWMLGSSLS